MQRAQNKQEAMKCSASKPQEKLFRCWVRSCEGPVRNQRHGHHSKCKTVTSSTPFYHRTICTGRKRMGAAHHEFNMDSLYTCTCVCSDNAKAGATTRNELTLILYCHTCTYHPICRLQCGQIATCQRYPGNQECSR